MGALFLFSATLVVQWPSLRKHSSLCSLDLSATSQQYFSLRINQPPATSPQYFSLRINQQQPSATTPPAKRTDRSELTNF
jgi:hypothetical protein